jgi:hypothetical protein
VHLRARADVEAAGRLARHDELRLAAEATGEDDLLDVAAGKKPGRRGRTRAADVEGGDRLEGEGVQRSEAQEAEALDPAVVQRLV